MSPSYMYDIQGTIVPFSVVGKRSDIDTTVTQCPGRDLVEHFCSPINNVTWSTSMKTKTLCTSNAYGTSTVANCTQHCLEQSPSSDRAYDRGSPVAYSNKCTCTKRYAVCDKINNVVMSKCSQECSSRGYVDSFVMNNECRCCR